MKDEYELAVTGVGQPKGNEEMFDLQHPDNSLAQHLVILYWMGAISIDEPNSLISRFFKTAPDTARSHAIDFAGRAVWNSEGEVPMDILNRLQHLFDTRLDAAKHSKSPETFKNELLAFQPWLYSRKFDEKWTLRSLEETLNLTKGQRNYSGYALDPLMELSYRHPLDVLRCVKIMIQSNLEQWGWYMDPVKTKAIFRNALKNNNIETSQTVTEIQDILIRRGSFEYRNLES